MSIYQIVVKVIYDQVTEMRNVHHYEFPSYVPSLAELQEAVDGVDGSYKANLITGFVNEVDFYAYDVRRVDVADLPAVEMIATAGGWQGTSVIDPLPSQICALVTFKAPTTFPRTTRTYLFPMSEGNNDNSGTLNGALLGLLGTWADSLYTLIIVGNTNARKVAVKYGGSPRVVIASNELITRKVSGLWATQRRRRLGVGI
jgi:hypothetical protein